jgi:hypothetical protein
MPILVKKIKIKNVSKKEKTIENSIEFYKSSIELYKCA